MELITEGSVWVSLAESFQAETGQTPFGEALERAFLQQEGQGVWTR